MAELKTKQNDGDVEAFLQSVSDEQRRADALELLEIFKQATGEAPKMWGPSIVGFGEFPYKRADGTEYTWMCSGFSPRKQNISLYIMSGFGEYAEASGFDPSPLLEKLGPHSLGKSCLYIKRLSDIDKKVLTDLVRASHQHMKNSNKSA